MADIAAPEAAMEFETVTEPKPAEDCENGGSKLSREADDDELGENGEKRAKIEVVSAASPNTEAKIEEVKKSGVVSVGPKKFESSVEMFDYFYKILHSWTPNLDLNKYEHKVLLELLKKGHLEADRKIGNGIKAFQVRFHPQYRSRCFFLLREDESVDDFSFRKCVDHISPLPENMQIKHEVNKALRGKGGGFRGRGGRGRGRGGR